MNAKADQNSTPTRLFATECLKVAAAVALAWVLLAVILDPVIGKMGPIGAPYFSFVLWVLPLTAATSYLIGVVSLLVSKMKRIRA